MPIESNDLRIHDGDNSVQEKIIRRLDPAEYNEFLVEAGLDPKTRDEIGKNGAESRANLDRFLRRIGVNFDPDFSLGKSKSEK